MTDEVQEVQEPTCVVELVHVAPQDNEQYPWGGTWPPPEHLMVARVKAPGRPSVTTVMDAREWVEGNIAVPHAHTVIVYDQVAIMPAIPGVTTGRVPKALYTRRMAVS